MAVSDIPAKLVQGSVVMRDNQLFVHGIADSQEDAKDIQAIIKSNLPAGYEVNRKLSVLPRRVNSPVLSAEKSLDGNVIVNGTYVDEAGKSRIEMLFGPSIGAGEVTLNLEPVRTEVPSNWTPRLAGAADILTTLKNGSLTATPSGIVVEGTTDLLTEDFNARFSNMPNFSSSVVGLEPELREDPVETTFVETSDQPLETAISANVEAVTKPTVFAFLPDSEDINGFQIPKISGEITRQNCVYSASSLVIESKIEFKTGSDNIDEASKATLDKLAAVLRPCTARLSEIIQIGGHTDSQGQADSNMALSLARAMSVRDALIARGVDQSFLKAQGFGETQPIADDGTAEGRAENRRIEFEIVEN